MTTNNLDNTVRGTWGVPRRYVLVPFKRALILLFHNNYKTCRRQFSFETKNMVLPKIGKLISKTIKQEEKRTLNEILLQGLPPTYFYNKCFNLKRSER